MTNPTTPKEVTEAAVIQADALGAIDAAIREFAAKEQSYRNPNGEAARRMSKKNRQDLAAQYAGWQRDLATIATAIREDSRHD